MAVRKQPRHVVTSHKHNTAVVIDGEKYMLDDPIEISFGFVDLMTPLFGFNTSTSIIMFGIELTNWYGYLATIIGYIGLTCSIWFLGKALWYLARKHNTGKVPSLTRIAF